DWSSDVCSSDLDVEVWVPPLVLVPAVPGILARMRSLRLLQTVTAGVDAYRPHLPEGVVLCNARGVHDAGTAEWAAGALIAVVREFPEFADAQRRGAWTYRHTPALSSEERRVGGECRARGVHLQLDRRVGQ